MGEIVGAHLVSQQPVAVWHRCSSSTVGQIVQSDSGGECLLLRLHARDGQGAPWASAAPTAWHEIGCPDSHVAPDALGADDNEKLITESTWLADGMAWLAG